MLILKRSVLTEEVARHGLHLTREYTIDPLEAFFACEVVTPVLSLAALPTAAPRLVVYGDQTLREVAPRSERRGTADRDGMSVAGDIVATSTQASNCDGE